MKTKLESKKSNGHERGIPSQDSPPASCSQQLSDKEKQESGLTTTEPLRPLCYNWLESCSSVTTSLVVITLEGIKANDPKVQSLLRLISTVVSTPSVLIGVGVVFLMIAICSDVEQDGDVESNNKIFTHEDTMAKISSIPNDFDKEKLLQDIKQFHEAKQTLKAKELEVLVSESNNSSEKEEFSQISILLLEAVVGEEANTQIKKLEEVNRLVADHISKYREDNPPSKLKKLKRFSRKISSFTLFVKIDNFFALAGKEKHYPTRIQNAIDGYKLAIEYVNLYWDVAPPEVVNLFKRMAENAVSKKGEARIWANSKFWKKKPSLVKRFVNRFQIKWLKLKCSLIVKNLFDNSIEQVTNEQVSVLEGARKELAKTVFEVVKKSNDRKLKQEAQILESYPRPEIIEHIRKQSKIFEEKRSELLEQYSDNYVLFEDGKVIDFDKDEMSLAIRAYEKGQTKSLFIKKVTPKDPEIVINSNFLPLVGEESEETGEQI
jgi:glycerol-3-phosphate cytidylyltransferase-like family protein